MPKKFVPTNIGFIINDLRTTHKISQYKMEKDLKFSRENINAIENIRTNPSLHTFITLLNYFGCDIEIVRRKDKKILGTLQKID